MLFASLVMAQFDPLRLLCQFTLFYRSVHNVHAFGRNLNVCPPSPRLSLRYLSLTFHVSDFYFDKYKNEIFYAFYIPVYIYHLLLCKVTIDSPGHQGRRTTPAFW